MTDISLGEVIYSEKFRSKYTLNHKMRKLIHEKHYVEKPLKLFVQHLNDGTIARMKGISEKTISQLISMLLSSQTIKLTDMKNAFYMYYDSGSEIRLSQPFAKMKNCSNLCRKYCFDSQKLIQIIDDAVVVKKVFNY